MEIVKTIEEVRTTVKKWKIEGKSVGFVPTMGYLHQGHQSLIKRACQENEKVVVSIFVNPTQFGPNEDFSSYPRDIDRDSEVCSIAGADLIFHPETEEMYDSFACTYVNVDGLTDKLCGKSRPTHFRGVCTVVSKLFLIVNPDRAYFGQKDAQQLAVIKRMVRDLNFDIEIVGCPIIREEDGLAKSSRNTYLSVEEREAATVLNRALTQGRVLISEGEKSVDKVKNLIQRVIEAEPLARIDYIEVVDFETIEPISLLEGTVLVAVASYIGKTRLIDNFILKI
ncbi:pantoate--beta-alanine ligase [Lachnotalea glycerini]|uniref:Pantothenate synthetase n=1 Tax=Lachnotalea glycerini TaxID=1763509 RepID=A0A318ESZ7_9FIRM|nr:pantoate--beta-alanine ligase [Lachnotalea glycerini]PXV95412.1 pantoate--beta-alanine ligase [Lachnotalea glycerini]